MTCKTIALSVLFLIVAAHTGYADYEWGQWDYTLDYQLDARTGRYRPAYTHSSAKGTQTVWLDRAPDRALDRQRRGGAPTDPLLVQVEWPRGWQVEKKPTTASARARDGSSFTIFASREGRAHRSDFMAEWSSRLGRHGAVGEDEIRRYDDGTVVAQVGVRRTAAGGVVALCIVYQANRALPVVIDFPDLAAAQRNLAAMETFFGTIKLTHGKLAP